MGAPLDMREIGRKDMATFQKLRYLIDKGILGEGAPSADFVGVAYPDGSVTGDENNVKFRFDTTYMQMAADGAL